jgi:S-adenosyl-L-homocysteine hydrolase, NAD binding domain
MLLSRARATMFLDMLHSLTVQPSILLMLQLLQLSYDDLLLLQVVTLEQAVQSGADVYLTTTGVTGTVAALHLTAMKDGAVVGSIGIGTPHGEIEVSTSAPVTYKHMRCFSTACVIVVA